MSAAAAMEKRRRTMVTPEGIALPITVGSRGARIGALVLDFTFLYFGMLAFVLILMLLLGSLFTTILDGLEDQVAGVGEFFVVIFILFLFVARYGYFLSMELGPRGATWGKRIVGLRVAARDGGRLTAEAVIARNLIRDIELFLPLAFVLAASEGQMGSAGLAGAIWFTIFMAFPFFNKDAMRAGDVIAGTWVVEAPRTKRADTMSTQGAASGTSGVTGAKYEFGDEELAVYGEHELQTLERLLRNNQDDALLSVHATICGKIGWAPGAGDERAFLEAFYAQLRAKLEGDMRFGKRKKDKFS
ncbi:MAG: RDD family protein [Erythrobacter sp.]